MSLSITLIYHFACFISVLSAIATINRSIDTGNAEGTFGALSLDHACISDLDEENAARYQAALEKTKNDKQEVFIGNFDFSKNRFKSCF